MNRAKLKRLIDQEAVVQAIREVEARTSGEIRVSISTFFWGSIRRTAERAFARMKMDQTARRNGVLIFVVPSRRSFVVLGDEGVHAAVGQEFWDGVTAAMSKRFRNGDFTGGLLHGIREAGRQLETHFPGLGAKDVNELPDAIDFGGPRSAGS